MTSPLEIERGADQRLFELGNHAAHVATARPDQRARIHLETGAIGAKRGDDVRDVGDFRFRQRLFRHVVRSGRGFPYRKALVACRHAIAARTEKQDVFGGDLRIGVKDARAFHDIAQFTDVAGPVVCGERLHCCFGKDRLGAHLLQEVGNKFRHVLAAFGERGEVQRKDIQAIKQVFAEAAVRNRLLKILVRGRDDADIDRLGFIAADALDLTFFKHAKQFHLHIGRHVADFVEKDGAAVRRLESALAGLQRAGEGALLVAEKFGFEKFAGDRATVHSDEIARATR